MTKPWRARRSDSTACCSTRFTGNNRMLGLVTASQLASASATSFLLLFTYGLTNCGDIKRTVWPKPCRVRAQWWTLRHASMPMRHGGRFTKNVVIWSRRSCLRSATLPCSSTCVNLEYVLCQVDANSRNLHGGRPSRFKWSVTPLWHVDAGTGGGVHPIGCGRMLPYSQWACTRFAWQCERHLLPAAHTIHRRLAERRLVVCQIFGDFPLMPVGVTAGSTIDGPGAKSFVHSFFSTVSDALRRSARRGLFASAPSLRPR